VKLSEKVKLMESMPGAVHSKWHQVGFKNYQEAQRAAYVSKYGIPWLIEELDKGMIVYTAVRIARLPDEHQYEVLKGNMKLPKNGEHKVERRCGDWSMPTGDLKNATYSERVRAMMQDIAKGGRRAEECCARYGLSIHDYKRGRMVIRRAHQGLIDAVDHGVIRFGETDGMLSLDDADLSLKVEGLVVAHEMQKADPRSKRGNFNGDSLRALLQRTYVEWRGVSFTVRINAKILPATEDGIESLRRDAVNCRNAVNMVLDSLDKEITKRCSHAIQELSVG